MAHGCTYCTDDFHCEKFTDEKYTSWCYGKDYPCKDRKITKADRIRAMTDEELADMFDKEVSGGVICPPNHTYKYCAAGNCQKCWLDWLKEEVHD